MKTGIKLLFVFILLSYNIYAGEYPKTIIAKYGTTPTLDGNISEGEYDDATYFTGLSDWESGTGSPSSDAEDLSVKCWVKHDGQHIYFAFDVTDDVLYGIDIDRWVHDNNLTPHTLDYEGWPWFGDGMEIMMNSSYKWSGTTEAIGDAKSWQVVFSTHKSIKNGLDAGGLMMGVPDTDYAWGNYRDWIDDEDIKTEFRLKTEEEGRGYIVEWRVSPNPCMKDDDGNFIDLYKESTVGFNLEFQDLDEKSKGDGNWSNMHHIDFLAKVDGFRKTALKSYASLKIEAAPENTSLIAAKEQLTDLHLNSYPNPFNKSTTINYDLEKQGMVLIEVYNQLGQHVSTIVNQIQESGNYSIEWQGTDENNNELPAGIYIISLSHGNSQVIHKLIKSN